MPDKSTGCETVSLDTSVPQISVKETPHHFTASIRVLGVGYYSAAGNTKEEAVARLRTSVDKARTDKEIGETVEVEKIDY